VVFAGSKYPLLTRLGHKRSRASVRKKLALLLQQRSHAVERSATLLA